MKHIINSLLLETPHPITITLIGCGGTGCAVLRQLAQMNVSLLELGHNGLHVIVWDDDEVMPHNVGRQSVYSKADVGEYKGAIAVTRVNRFYGTQWEFKAEMFTKETAGYEEAYSNIMITCVDTMSARISLKKALTSVKFSLNNLPHHTIYWMDFGNSRVTGQVVLGCLLDKNMPDVLDLFPNMAAHEDLNEPSCSMAESLASQDLFINSTIAQFGCNILWQLFRNTTLDHHGVFVNLETLVSQPIKIKDHEVLDV